MFTVYQGRISRKYGAKFQLPVLYYSQLTVLVYGDSAGPVRPTWRRSYYSQLTVLVYGGSAKDAGLDGQVIRARKLEEFAGK